MTFRAVMLTTGWGVQWGDPSAREFIWMRPDQFGRVRSFSCQGTTAPKIDFAEIGIATKRARQWCKARNGRYGSRTSQLRGHYCEALAASLNADLPTPSVSEE